MSITLEEVVDILSDAEIPGGDDERVVASFDNGELKVDTDGCYYAQMDELFIDEFKKEIDNARTKV